MIIGTFHDESGNEITSHWELVTPDMALHLLTFNSDVNRPLKPGRVDAIANDIVSGFWAFNGNPVCFDYHGVLMNGQHRLNAVVKSGIAVHMQIYRGMNPDAIENMDQDLPRSTADLLHTSRRNIDNASTVLAVASILTKIDPALRNYGSSRPRLADFAWDNRDIFAPLASWTSTATHGDLFINPTHPYAAGKQTRRAVSASALGALVYVMTIHHGADRESVQTFWSDVISGTSTYPKMLPNIKSVRNYLRTTAPLIQFGGGGTQPMLKVFDTMIRAYNHWTVGETITRITPGRGDAPSTISDLTLTTAAAKYREMTA
jgi:hypothetical protein